MSPSHLALQTSLLPGGLVLGGLGRRDIWKHFTIGRLFLMSTDWMFRRILVQDEAQVA